MKAASPLRYPGGKWRVSRFFEAIIELNDLRNCDYVEPYAGGASLALTLLLNGTVSQIHLNDIDEAVFCFWWSVLNRSNELVDLIRKTPLTLREWRKQRGIYERGAREGWLELGFATMFLNRTNHSGIMNGGVIGGKEQSGEWLIDARFNREDLVRRVLLIAAHRSRIHISRSDALDFLNSGSFGKRPIVYLDPPYFKAGKALYYNAYGSKDHRLVRDAVTKLKHPWVISYDDVEEVRGLYEGYRSRRISLLHTARNARIGKEVMFFSPVVRIPKLVTRLIPSTNAS